MSNKKPVLCWPLSFSLGKGGREGGKEGSQWPRGGRKEGRKGAREQVASERRAVATPVMTGLDPNTVPSRRKPII